MADTIKVKRDGPLGWHNIAVASFNPDIHVPVGGSGQAPRVQGTPEELGIHQELGTDSGDQFSDEQLREVIETMTGEKPHHRTGRDKLVATYNALNAEA